MSEPEPEVISPEEMAARRRLRWMLTLAASSRQILMTDIAVARATGEDPEQAAASQMGVLGEHGGEHAGALIEMTLSGMPDEERLICLRAAGLEEGGGEGG